MMAMREIAETLELGRAQIVNLPTGRRDGAASSVRRFESFVLDVHSRELRKGDRAVMLQAQPFELLRLLLDRAGQIVERDDLRRRLWPDGTVVDYEHGLNAAVKRLRNLLGDDAVQPRFIETIPRRGYRFIAPVFGSHTGSHRPLHTNTNAIRLAVLPFAHVGPVEQMAGGIAEELRAQLARLCMGTVAVISRSSSMLFECQARRASAIGDALRAEYLLEGSVRGDGDRARITVCLIETVGETHVWSETVERRSSGPLSAQVEIATSLAQSLTRKLLATS
jgi:DNA-binding winged helix-turn-helix (wHTH) protein